MGFSNGSYANIKEVCEKHDKYTVCRITMSSKNKTSGKYEVDFVEKVRFAGLAHKSVPTAGQRIKITRSDVSNCYKDADDKMCYHFPRFVIFEYELQASKEISSAIPYNPYDNGVAFEELSVEDDLPF